MKFYVKKTKRVNQLPYFSGCLNGTTSIMTIFRHKIIAKFPQTAA
ncbi:hypothetical protein [Alysiella crassa]|nr:hypothetical protein [Alysiella crassa]